MRSPRHTLEMPWFMYNGEKLSIDTTRKYQNGAMVVTVHTDRGGIVGGLWGILSVNLPYDSEILYPGEFYAKTWSENEGWSMAALRSGIFVDIGLRRKTGFVEAQLWRLA